jgi:hypothetical protein
MKRYKMRPVDLNGKYKGLTRIKPVESESGEWVRYDDVCLICNDVRVLDVEKYYENEV